MATYEELKKANTKIHLQTVDDSDFKKYGKRVDHVFSKPLTDFLNTQEIPAEGTEYIRTSSEFENIREMLDIQLLVFGDMRIQAGWCAGNNDSVNALEWHKGSECFIAATDCILALSDIFSIDGNNELDSNKLQWFFVEKGAVLELYATTLHFAPIRTSESGFMAGIILPRGTNEALTERSGTRDSLLFMRNKWLICRKGTKQHKAGGYPGLKGEALKIAVP
ncbi:MAG: DUF4867 family protein [Spirochaetia bacterium]